MFKKLKQKLRPKPEQKYTVTITTGRFRLWIDGNMPEREDSIDDQIIDLIIIAERLGMYDAAGDLKGGMKWVRY